MIKLGFCIPNCTMGGVTRLILTMMNAPVDHNIEWSGIAIGSSYGFDESTAKQFLRYCPIYAVDDTPVYQNLVSIVPNACQQVIDDSDVINLWGYMRSSYELDTADWHRKPMLVVAHGQCKWTTMNVKFSINRFPSEVIPVSVSQKGIECFPKQIQDDVHVIYNGVDFTRCAPVKPLDIDSTLIGYIGRITRRKGVLDIADAVYKLGEGYRGLFVGHDGRDRDRVLRRFAEYGDSILISPIREDIGSILASLGCLVISSPFEGGPLVAIESWVAGCPVVSTAVGIIPELEHQYGPMTYRIPFDAAADDMIAPILSAINYDGRVEKARKIAWELFSSSKMMKRYEEVIQKYL